MAQTRALGTSPSSDIIANFRTVLSLPADTLKRINEWLKARPDIFTSAEERLDAFEIESGAKQIGIPEPQFMAALSLVSTVLIAGAEGPPLKKLQEMGLAEFAYNLNLLVEGVNISASEREYTRQRGLALQTALPTLESADAICDLRAIFRRLPSPSTSQEHQSSIKTLLGFEPVVIVSIELNDAASNDSVCTFQVSEKGLKNLLKTLQDSLIQLDIVKNAKKSEGLLS